MTRTTTQAPRRIRALVLACACALALSVPAVAAQAADNNPDPGVRCAAKIGPGEYEFYLPGERATDKDGNKWVCGPDGQWFRDYSRIVLSPTVMTPVVRASLVYLTAATALR
jgi:hypothetical protein